MSRILVTLAAAALALSACSSDSTGPTPPPGLPGAYALQAAPGATLPQYIYSWNNVTTETPRDSGSVYLEADTLVITADGHYQHAMTVIARQGTVVVARTRYGDHGLWTRTGDAVHFESEYIENVTFDAVVGADGVLATSSDLIGDGPHFAFLLKKF